VPGPPLYRFCPTCATPLNDIARGGRLRPACPACGFTLFRNPVVGVAVVVQRRGRVLLGRRSGSYRDLWCIPCGYVEWDEDVRLAAEREFAEETGLIVRTGAVVAVHSNFHNPVQHTVGIWFRGSVVGGSLQPGDDLCEAAFFSLDALPEPLAFPTDRFVLDLLREQQQQRRSTRRTARS
jgi:ADP-ribose pyrophosphatase YjhB (NUDIX family)